MLNGKHLKQIIDDTKIFQISAVPTVFLGFYFLLLLKSDTILLILAIILIFNSFLGLLKYEIKFKTKRERSIFLKEVLITLLLVGVDESSLLLITRL